jgi:hypothetical protein
MFLDHNIKSSRANNVPVLHACHYFVSQLDFQIFRDGSFQHVLVCKLYNAVFQKQFDLFEGPVRSSQQFLQGGGGGGFKTHYSINSILSRRRIASLNKRRQ